MAKHSIARNDAAAAERSPVRAEANSASTLHGVLRLSNKLMAPFSTYLEHRYKISLNEFRLLMLIGRFPNLASHDLVDMTGVNAMSVSRAVAALQKHGRIEVDRDATNRRRKTLALTEEGQRLYKAMRPQTDQVAEYLVAALTPDEILVFNRMLDKLVNTLEERDAEGRSLFLERTRPPGEA